MWDRTRIAAALTALLIASGCGREETARLPPTPPRAPYTRVRPAPTRIVPQWRGPFVSRCLAPPPPSGLYAIRGTPGVTGALVEGCVALTSHGHIVPLRPARAGRIEEDVLPTRRLDMSGLAVNLRAGGLTLSRFAQRDFKRTETPLGVLALAEPLDPADPSRVRALLTHPQPAAEVAAVMDLVRRVDDPVACGALTGYVAEHERDLGRVFVVRLILREVWMACMLPTLWRLLGDDAWGNLSQGLLAERLSPHDRVQATLELVDRLLRRSAALPPAARHMAMFNGVTLLNGAGNLLPRGPEACGGAGAECVSAEDRDAFRAELAALTRRTDADPTLTARARGLALGR